MDVISSEAVLSDLRSRLPPVTCRTCKKVLKRGEHRLMKSHLSRCHKIGVYHYNWSFVARHFKVPAEVRRGAPNLERKINTLFDSKFTYPSLA